MLIEWHGNSIDRGTVTPNSYVSTSSKLEKYVCWSNWRKVNLVIIDFYIETNEEVYMIIPHDLSAELRWRCARERHTFLVLSSCSYLMKTQYITEIWDGQNYRLCLLLPLPCIKEDIHISHSFFIISIWNVNIELWVVIRCGSKNKYQREMCFKKDWSVCSKFVKHYQ